MADGACVMLLRAQSILSADLRGFEEYFVEREKQKGARFSILSVAFLRFKKYVSVFKQIGNGSYVIFLIRQATLC